VVITSFDQWWKWSQTCSMLPVVCKYTLDEDRVLSWEKAWEMAGDRAIVLESGKVGRYSFIGLKPVSVILGKGGTAVVTDIRSGERDRWKGDPIPLVKRWMAPFRAPHVEGAPKFIGGCAGFWGYDVVRSLERLPETARDDLGLPDYCFMRFEELWIIDHAAKELYCAVHHSVTEQEAADADLLTRAYEQTLRRARDMKSQWDRIASANADSAIRTAHGRRLALLRSDSFHVDAETFPDLQRSFAKSEFIDAVKRIQQYIAAGDVFQVNLSVRQSSRLAARPELIYEWLRLVNPSPYMGFLQFGDFQLVSASPELLVQLERSTVRTRPIAGTRPRGQTEEEDARLARELLGNEKGRAEHIMLVDLERNDLGRISRYGTVKVTELMAVERYSHVMHLVSEVRGELAAGKDAYDVVAAVFPGGTITGAPKIRTMEIIEELEPVRRGPYTGSVGWIDYNGNMEFNIIIRTLVSAGGMGHIQAGAGIVIDSVPEREYVESLNKAKALWKAVRLSSVDPASG